METSVSDMSLQIGGQATYDWLKVTLDTTAKNKTTSNVTKHHILGKLSVDNYYSSVDEGSTKLSPGAVNLLKTNDLLGFFQSCGPYYVRSIGRRKSFLVVFTYESDKQTRDTSFEAKLTVQLKKFGSSPGSAGGSVTASTSFNQESENKKLTISAKGIGLGKSANSSLLATDLEGFKKVIDAAFKATQDDFTGRVRTMEVTPWVENVGFQANVPLAETTLDDGTKVPRFKMKLNLNENAEFYMRVLRVGRAMLNTYYKSRLCRQFIVSSYYKGAGDTLAIKDEFKDKSLRHQKGGKPTKLDAFLRAELTPAKVNGLYTKYAAFQDKTRKCLTKMTEQDLRYATFRDIAGSGQVCAGIEKDLAYIGEETIDSYCMPVMVD